MFLSISLFQNLYIWIGLISISIHIEPKNHEIVCPIKKEVHQGPWVISKIPEITLGPLVWFLKGKILIVIDKTSNGWNEKFFFVAHQISLFIILYNWKVRV